MLCCCFFACSAQINFTKTAQTKEDVEAKGRESSASCYARTKAKDTAKEATIKATHTHTEIQE